MSRTEQLRLLFSSLLDTFMLLLLLVYTWNGNMSRTEQLRLLFSSLLDTFMLLLLLVYTWNGVANPFACMRTCHC